MKQTSLDKIYEILGRLYVQVWTNTEELESKERSLSELTKQNEQLSKLLNSKSTEPKSDTVGVNDGSD